MAEAVTAVEKLGGRSLGASDIESACKTCGVDTSREMDRKEFTLSSVCYIQARLTHAAVDEFVRVVRHLESSNSL